MMLSSTHTYCCVNPPPDDNPVNMFCVSRFFLTRFPPLFEVSMSGFMFPHWKFIVTDRSRSNTNDVAVYVLLLMLS
jgi:hypothetical protein